MVANVTEAAMREEGYVHNVIYNTARCCEVVAALQSALETYLGDGSSVASAPEELTVGVEYAGSVVEIALFPTDRHPSVFRDRWAEVGLCQVSAGMDIVANGATYIQEHDRIPAVSLPELLGNDSRHRLDDQEAADALFDAIFEACHRTLRRRFTGLD